LIEFIIIVLAFIIAVAISYFCVIYNWAIKENKSWRKWLNLDERTDEDGTA